jgi:hypothetical protein
LPLRRIAPGKESAVSLDKEFWEAVGPLYVESMGTEAMAPVLYDLIRFVRPRKLLEVGVGYSTPFILQALKDNRDDFEREKARVAQAQHAQGALLREAYFTDDYSPLLHAIDDMSHPKGRIPEVLDAVGRLRLEPFLKWHKADFRGYGPTLGGIEQQFDFVWFDCPVLAEFLEEYWPVIDEEGGLLLIHSTLTNLSKFVVLQELKLRQASQKFMDFELLSLLEPHKTAQNSVTIIRKISRVKNRFYSVRP